MKVLFFYCPTQAIFQQIIMCIVFIVKVISVTKRTRRSHESQFHHNSRVFFLQNKKQNLNRVKDKS